MNIRPALTVLLLMVSSATLAQDATLIIKADATCDLTVNEEHQGQLTKDVAKAVKTSGGVQLIECKAPNGASVRYLDSVTAGNHTELQIELAALVRAKDENITERFEALGYGMVRDSKTGLVWSQSDNGQGISWYDAREHCANLRTGVARWRLPIADELRAIHDESGTLRTQCGVTPLWWVSPLFDLGDDGFWSTGPEGYYSEPSWMVNLTDGTRFPFSPDSTSARALCVRRG